MRHCLIFDSIAGTAVKQTILEYIKNILIINSKIYLQDCTNKCYKLHLFLYIFDCGSITYSHFYLPSEVSLQINTRNVLAALARTHFGRRAFGNDAFWQQELLGSSRRDAHVGHLV